jgi:uncharacterized protein YpuA (DUF1002 family)
MAEAEQDPLKCAIIVAKEIQSASEKASALAGIVRAYAEAGQYDRALEVAKEIEYAYWKAIALADIAKAYAEAGQKVTEEQSKILHEIIKTAIR